MNKITFIKIFEADPQGHGGQKRAYQLEKLISIPFSNLLLDFQPKRRLSLRRDFYVTFKFLISSLIKLSFTNYRWKSILTVKSKSAEKFIDTHSVDLKYSNVIWEASFPEFYTLPKKLKKISMKKIIACPHNLESLIEQEYVKWGELKKTQRLEMELESLRNCDYVFTISEEEQWLLNNFGIKAKYLPYYPEGICFDKLIKIRQERLFSSDLNTLLILGSATNTPTYEGMKRLIEYIFKSKLNAKFVIAGFGTEIFSKFESNNIQCMGTVRDEELHKLMMKTKAIIISQGFSTGALTKIPEFLVAGIPVIVDEGSSRSFKRFDGVYQISSLDELSTVITTINEPITKMPIRPEKEYQNFWNCLNLSIQ